MALITVVRNLNPWIARNRLLPNDFILDRAMFRKGVLPEHELRYIGVIPLPDAGEATGWVLRSLTDGDLEEVAAMTRHAGAFPSEPWLRCESGVSVPPPSPAQIRPAHRPAWGRRVGDR